MYVCCAIRMADRAYRSKPSNGDDGYLTKKFPFKNETQVDLNGFDAKNRVTSNIFIWINRSKCNLINSLWVFDDISHIHWDIVVCRMPIFNAIMHIFSKKSARLLFARLSKVACLLFSFSYLPVFVAFSPFFLLQKSEHPIEVLF